MAFVGLGLAFSLLYRRASLGRCPLVSYQSVKGGPQPLLTLLRPPKLRAGGSVAGNSEPLNHLVGKASIVLVIKYLNN